jgi:hypothetical protein
MAETFMCPNCGADVPLKALACPECGSDKETGWSEAAKYSHLLPDRGDTVSRPRGQKFVVSAIAGFLLVAMLAQISASWMLPTIAAIVAIGAIGYFAYHQYDRSSWGMEAKLYSQLKSRTHGDRAQVERLVEYERNRAPEASRIQLLQNAIYRWDCDR